MGRPWAAIGGSLLLLLAAPPVLSASTWTFDAPGNVAVRIVIHAAPGSDVELVRIHDVRGVGGEAAFMEAEIFPFGWSMERALVFAAGEPRVHARTEGLRVHAETSLLSSSFTSMSRWGYNPGTLYLAFGWTGNVTRTSYVLHVEDPLAVVEWHRATSVEFRTLRDFQETGELADADALGAGVAHAEGARTTVPVTGELLGFSWLAGGVSVGDADLRLVSPGPGRDARDLSFVRAPAGAYGFEVDQTTAGLFPERPYVLLADFPPVTT